MQKLLLCFLCACGGASATASTTTTATSSSASNTSSPSNDDDDYCLAFHFKGNYAQALTRCTAACSASMKDSCGVLGQMYSSGEGVTADARRAEGLFAKACQLGDTRSCAPAARSTTTSTATTTTPTAPSMQLSIGSIDADGMRLSNLSCSDVQGGVGGGIFGGIALAAGFKMRKAQLDACASHATDTRVDWIGAGGHMTHVKASGADATVGRCVERALADAPSTIAGTCTATVHHGR